MTERSHGDELVRSAMPLGLKIVVSALAAFLVIGAGLALRKFTAGNGHIDAAGKVGVIKPIVMRGSLQVTANGLPLATSGQPTPLTGPSATLAWKPCPGAAKYDVRWTVWSSPDGTGGGITPAVVNPEYAEGPRTVRTLDFQGVNPPYSRERSYELLITAKDAAGNEVGSSQSLLFRTPDALLPVSTKGEAAKLLPPDWRVESFQTSKPPARLASFHIGSYLAIQATKPQGESIAFPEVGSVLNMSPMKLEATPADRAAGRERILVTLFE